MSCLRNCFHQLILFFTPPLVQERARAKAKAKAPRHNLESWKNFRGPTFSEHETHGKVSGISKYVTPKDNLKILSKRYLEYGCVDDLKHVMDRNHLSSKKIVGTTGRKWTYQDLVNAYLVGGMRGMGEVGGLYQQLGFSVSPGQIRRGSCPKRQRKGQEQGQEQEQVTWLEECLTLQLSSLASLELVEVLGRTSISYWNRWTIDPPLYESLLRMAQLFQPNLWCLQLWYVTCWQCYVRLEVILRDVPFSFAVVRWCWSRCVSFFSTQVWWLWGAQGGRNISWWDEAEQLGFHILGNKKNPIIRAELLL